MWQLIFKQVLKFLVMACLVMIAGFSLLRLMPGDAVRLEVAGYSSDGLKNTAVKQKFRETWYRSGSHLPVFFLSISSLAVPDSFYYLPDPVFRSALIRLSILTGNPTEVYKLLGRDISSSWKTKYKPSEINCSRLAEYYSEDQWKKLESEAATWKKFVPVVYFNPDNQFRQWLTGSYSSKGILNGDLGISRYSGRKVWDEILPPLKITTVMTFISLFLSSLLAVILSLWLSGKSRRFQVHFLSPLFLALYSIPVFWLGTWLLFLFANSDFIQLFPASGIYGAGEEHSFKYWLWLLLPVICYSLGAILFLTRLLMEGYHLESQLDYTRTAFAKGLLARDVRKKHQFRNLLFPALAVIAGSFPVMLGGSALIEQIFSIPGLGSLMVRAVQTRDIPLLSGFFLITAMITILVFLMIDLLARVIDPRIRTGAGELNSIPQPQ